jgi:hypothetical protein
MGFSEIPIDTTEFMLNQREIISQKQWIQFRLIDVEIICVNLKSCENFWSRKMALTDNSTK